MRKRLVPVSVTTGALMSQTLQIVCSNCGTKNEILADGSEFIDSEVTCSNCGARLGTWKSLAVVEEPATLDQTENRNRLNE